MFFQKASGGRAVRSLEGEGMVTVTKPVTVTYRDGTREQLVPGRHRFAPHHELVKPEHHKG